MTKRSHLARAVGTLSWFMRRLDVFISRESNVGLDRTGLELRKHKRWEVPAYLTPIRLRLALDVEGWVITGQSYDSPSWRVAGRVESISAAAERAGRRRFNGLRAGQAIYSKEVT